MQYGFYRYTLQIYYGLLLKEHEPFSTWFPLKGHTYLKNLQLKAAGLFKYVWPFNGHQALKG